MNGGGPPLISDFPKAFGGLEAIQKIRNRPSTNFFQKPVDTQMRASPATLLKKSTEIKSLGDASFFLLAFFYGPGQQQQFH